MTEYRRPHFKQLLQRINEFPRWLIVVTGPRQVGKTTLVRQVLNALEIPSRYCSVDQPTEDSTPVFPGSVSGSATTRWDQRSSATSAWLIEQWENARVIANRSNVGAVLVLDEIQKIPQWSEVVKGLWDQDRQNNSGLRVVLLGSAPLLLHTGLTESLAGRTEAIRMTHWSFSEMEQAFGFNLPSFLYYGGYPGAATLTGDPRRWRDYVRASLIEPNIERDILAMTRVDKPALLKRTFELSCDYSGQILSYTKMVGQLQDAGNTTTLAHYLDLLASAGMVVGLQKYAGEQHRRRASSPKLNVLNTALMSVNSGYELHQAEADRSFWGRLVESAAGAHLVNSASADVIIYYWRSSPYEVDFVLVRGKRVIGVEIKSGLRTQSRGLEEFNRQFNPERILLVGSDELPLIEFLSHPADYWFDS